MPRFGFTIMELLVTMSIIAILASLLFPAINMVRNNAKKTVTLQRVSQLGNACEAYRLLTRRVPDEQGVVWTWNSGSKTSTPAWIATTTFPISHRECISTSTTGSLTLRGIADLLEEKSDLQLPGEAFSKSGPVDGLVHIVDGWGNPLRYQRLSEITGGVMQLRASWWLAVNGPGGNAQLPPVAIAGATGDRDGFVIYSPGRGTPREARQPASPQDDTATDPGRWWNQDEHLLYRSSGQ